MHTLDTNAIIYYLKGEQKTANFIEKLMLLAEPIYISAITEIELFSFSNTTLTELEQIESILRTIAVIPVDSRIARIAGLLRREYKLKTADSAIAATALFTGTKLVTRNWHDFNSIPNLNLYKL